MLLELTQLGKTLLVVSEISGTFVVAFCRSSSARRMPSAGSTGTLPLTSLIRAIGQTGEGLLIGVQTVTLNAQVTFVDIAVAISAFVGAKNGETAPSPDSVGACEIFGRFLGAGT